MTPIDQLTQDLVTAQAEIARLRPALQNMFDNFKYMQTAFNDSIFDDAREALSQSSPSLASIGVGSIKQQAESWCAVVAALDEVMPDWLEHSTVGMECAVAAINKLAAHDDTKRLDFLQSLGTGYGNGWILRESINGRGIRLHETGQEVGTMPTVREAIDDVRKIKND